MEDASKYLYNYLQYDDLKKEALDYIKKIGYNKWNYYGEHDPGITILENLLFGIIDFDYRMSFPVEDIIAKNPKDRGNLKMYYTPEEILPINPVTINDYYKLILDNDNIKNCRIIPRNKENEVSGLYDIYIHVEPHTDKKIEETKRELRAILYKNRNICEDFNLIEDFEQVNVSIDIDIEVQYELNNVNTLYESIAGYILAHLQNYLLPGIKFRKLSELLDKGINLEDIYNGPLLNHGFILDEDINNYALKTNIYIIDILEFINKMPYVVTLNNFTIQNLETNEIYLNCIKLKENQVLRIDFKKSNFRISCNGFNVIIDKDKYVSLAKRQYNALNNKDITNDEEVGVFEGKYRNLLEYASIQYDFPLIYGVGEEGLHSSATNKAKEDCHYLKCFLLLFDQIFYKFQVNFENLKNLIAIESNNSIRDLLVKDVPFLNTLIQYPSNFNKNTKIENYGYYIQRKYLIKNHDKDIIFPRDIHEYLKFLNEEVNYFSRSNVIDYIIKTLFRDNYIEIKKNLLLLKNFNFKKKQEYLSNCISIEKEKIKGIVLSNNSQWEGYNISGLERKIALFLDIHNFKRRMLHLFFKDNIYQWSTNSNDNNNFNSKNIEIKYTCKYKNITELVLKYGDEKDNYIIEECKKNDFTNDSYSQSIFNIKISINLTNNFIYLIVNHDILTYEDALEVVKRSVTNINKFNKNSEGFHLIENILLRPKDNSLNFKHIPDENIINEDIFSCRITIVFPNWPAKFQNKKIKEYIIQWLYNNCPAHIKLDILWLNLKEMNVFENMYKHWYDVFNNNLEDDKIKDKASFDFIQLILKLKNKRKITNCPNNKNNNISTDNIEKSDIDENTDDDENDNADIKNDNADIKNNNVDINNENDNKHSKDDDFNIFDNPIK